MDRVDRAGLRAYLIPAIFAAGALLSRLLAHFIAPFFPADFAQAMPVATYWGVAGTIAWMPLALAIVLAGCLWWRMLDEPPPLATVIAVSALSLAAALCWRPVFSSDVYAYAAYGEMARLGLDPYLFHPALSDSIVKAAQWQWSGSLPVCVYGDAFVAFARAIVTLVPHLGPALMTFRICACIALLLCAALVKGRAAFFLACNPVAIYACAEGHNDVIMILAAVAGITLARRAPFAGAALVAASAAIKAPGIAAGAALAALHSEDRDARTILAGTLTGGILAFAGSFRLIAGALHTVVRHGSYHPFASVQAMSPLLALAVGAAACTRLRSFGSRYDRLVAAALIGWLLIPNPYAWYALWILTPAAFSRDRRIALTAAGLSGVAMLRYLPDAAGIPAGWFAALSGLIALIAYLPLVRNPQRSYGILRSP